MTTEGARPSVAAANRAALERLVAAHPILVDCRPAASALGLSGRVVLHSGPPLPWDRACPTVQAAVLCAIRYEGWAATDDEARERLRRGEIALGPCHHA